MRRYKLTGETGSYRYMAPEVFRHEPYNTKVRPETLRCSAQPSMQLLDQMLARQRP